MANSVNTAILVGGFSKSRDVVAWLMSVNTEIIVTVNVYVLLEEDSCLPFPILWTSYIITRNALLMIIAYNNGHAMTLRNSEELLRRWRPNQIFIAAFKSYISRNCSLKFKCNISTRIGHNNVEFFFYLFNSWSTHKQIL